MNNDNVTIIKESHLKVNTHDNEFIKVLQQ